MLKVLFVCSSDRTRAPMAAAAFTQIAAQAGLEDWCADSAGIHAQNGQMIAPEVRTILNERGIATLRIGAQPLGPKLIKGAELVICMTSDQAKEITKKYVVARNKTITLMSVLRSSAEVFDPNRMGEEKFRQCLDMMWPALEELAQRLQ